jgi:hypothetical protein
MPDANPLRPHLQPVIDVFDEVWYGVREPDQTTFTAYAHEIDQLGEIAGRAAETKSVATPAAELTRSPVADGAQR